jgi:elongation factor 1-beta
MGMVAMTYKLNPNSEVEDVDAEAIAEAVKSLASDVYDVQAVDVKPLAFGLKFVQVHVVMSDRVGGLSDEFEEQMSTIHGVGEIEVLSMGLL